MLNRRWIIAIILFIVAGLVIFAFANPLGNEEDDNGDPSQQEQIDQQEEEAEAAVEKAEESLLQEDVDDARDLVNDLPDGDKKDELNDRLDVVQDFIDAEEAVEKAEESLEQEDVDDARDLVDDLPEGDKKDELNDRLDEVQRLIDEQEEEEETPPTPTPPVVVADTTKPVITLLGDAIITIEVGDTYVDAGATASDNVDGNITSEIVETGSVDSNTIGTYMLYYDVEDDAGNDADQVTRTVHVVAAQPEPIIFFDKDDPAKTDIGSAWEEIEASSGDVYEDWIYARSYDEFDDTTYYSGSDLGCDVDPNCAYDVKYRFDAGSPEVSVPEIDLGITGLYRIIYRVYDETGNTRYRYRWVTVLDTTKPTLKLKKPFPSRLEEGMTEPDWSMYVKSYSDNADYPLILSINENVDMSTPGMYQVKYKVMETHTTGDSPYGGNRTPLKKVKTRDVEVVVAKPEKISFNTGWMPIFERDETATELPDAADIGTAWDEYDQAHIPAVFVNCKIGDSSGPIVSQAYAMDNPGEYWCSYKATDSTGNTRWNGRKVTIVPDKPEQIEFTTGWHPHFNWNPMATELPDSDNIGQAWDEYDQAYVPAVFMNCKIGDSSGPIVSQHYVMSHIGTYWCSYKATDSTGHTRYNGRHVTINPFIPPIPDFIPPVITLEDPNPYHMFVGGTYTEPGFTAMDNVDGNITGDVIVTGMINNMTPGTYYLYYNVEDDAGNPATQQIREVIVHPLIIIDLIPPVITLEDPNPYYMPVGATYVEPGFTAMDNVDGNITGDVIITGMINNMVAGTYTLYYDVEDTAGNPAVQVTRTVIVTPFIPIEDNTPPMIGISIDFTGMSSNLSEVTINVTDAHPFASGVDPTSLKYLLIPAGDPMPVAGDFAAGHSFTNGVPITRGVIQPSLNGPEDYNICVYAEDNDDNVNIVCDPTPFS